MSLKSKAAVTVLCVLVALAISLSRVYLGVHYLGDVLGGWLLGGAVMTLTAGVYVSVTSGRSAER